MSNLFFSQSKHFGAASSPEKYYIYNNWLIDWFFKDFNNYPKINDTLCPRNSYSSDNY